MSNFNVNNPIGGPYDSYTFFGWIVNGIQTMWRRINAVEAKEASAIIAGSFTITPDNTTTAFTHTVPSGYSICQATIESSVAAVSLGIIPYLQSCQIAGTTITVNIFNLDMVDQLITPVPVSTGPLEINYILSK